MAKKEKSKNPNELLVEKMRAAFGEEPGARLEEFVLKLPSESGEGEYYYLPPQLTLAAYRKDYPDAHTESEVVYHKEGASAGVKVSIYKGPAQSDLVADGYGEAVATGMTDAPLVTAYSRALNNALRNAGYGVPYWMGYLKILEDLTPSEGISAGEVMAEALELLSGAETINDGAVPQAEGEPKKRGRKKAEPAKAVAPVITANDIPDDFIPDIDEEVPGLYEDNAADKPLIDTIPDMITDEDILKYMPLLTEEDIKNFKVEHTGRHKGKTVEQLASNPAEKHVLRALANATFNKGRKAQLVFLKACELYGC